MREVSAFAADLLRILTCFLGRAPLAPVLPLLARATPRPDCLSRDAVAAIQDMLSKGCVLALARAGGWRPSRRPRGERVAKGRLWECSPPSDLALEFSANSLDFLLWATATNCAADDARWIPPAKETLTTGDRWLFYLAYSNTRGSTVADALRRGSPCDDHALCWLTFADDYTDEAIARLRPDFDAWTTSRGLLVLEAMQPSLARAWKRMEHDKTRVTTPARMRLRGDTQRCVLDNFLRAIDRVQRRDLALFLLKVCRRSLDDGPASWMAGLDVRELSFAHRSATYRAACAMLQSLETLGHWQEQARRVGFLDEGYASAQLWKARWERCDGDALCQRAAELFHQLDPLYAGQVQST